MHFRPRSALASLASLLALTFGALCAPACSGSVSLPAGAVAVTSFGSCGAPDGYAVVNASDCPGLSCAGSYYGLCDGTAWTACDCKVPKGYKEVGFHDHDGGGAGTDASESGPTLVPSGGSDAWISPGPGDTGTGGSEGGIVLGPGDAGGGG